ncbi:hypothetical protein AAZX31_12G140200 [Glycine max]|nr:hypothetical protein JHK82_033906 [Glycine max]KAH1143284.1 hypothetical protein GYH30_033814 [Glycine max]
MKKRALNDRLIAEKGFLDADGLQASLVFGPSSNHGRLISSQGFLILSLGRRLSSIQYEIWRVAKAIRRAAGAALSGEFT